MALAVIMLLRNGGASNAQTLPATPHIAIAHAAAEQHYAPGDYFVTGDSSTATLWRRERNGALTCISINACRRPVGE
jgi:hypothetical protein